MIAGDFNSKATAWGGRANDRRGTCLPDITMKNGIVSIRMTRADYTFSRNGGTSFIDVISVSKRLTRKYVGGKILYNFKTARTRHNDENFKYSTKDTDMEKFLLAFDDN